MRLGVVVSESGGGLDDRFAALAEALGAEGMRVAGAVQRTERDAGGRLAGMKLLLLPEMAPRDIAQRLGAGATGCRLDPGALEQATEEIARRVAAGADILIVPRFGEREAGGGGFRVAIAAAMEAGVPVLVGLSPAWRVAFDGFAGDVAVALPPDPGTLRSWAMTPTSA
ncbi:MAG: DUF2478 domain-containing protein [Paracoccaceae bacterium]|jgi:nucleoside-triphosphatase THEP1|nr:DUF2478 domain-containing protein [Paracoccaceae bacterium]